MQIHNYTPHVVRVVSSVPVSSGVAAPSSVFESEGCARLDQSSTRLDVIDACEVAAPTYGAVDGLPPPRAGHYYIVSQVVAQRLAGQRDDLLYPDSGPDAEGRGGQVYAVRRLLRASPPVLAPHPPDDITGARAWVRRARLRGATTLAKQSLGGGITRAEALGPTGWVVDTCEVADGDPYRFGEIEIDAAWADFGREYTWNGYGKR